MFVDTFEKVGIKVRVFSITDKNYQYIEHPEKYHGKIHMDNKTRR
jgi:hypothetical protein